MSAYNSKDFGRVAVLMGGMTPERDISLMTGKQITESLQRQGVDAFAIDLKDNPIQQIQDAKCDRVFIALHGQFGEDGTVQAILESLNLPYTGSGVLGSAIGMEKVVCKKIWQASGLPVIPFEVIRSVDQKDDLIREFGLPMCVKPSRSGSSVGVSKVKRAEDFEDAYQEALKYDHIVLAEPWLAGRELSIAVVDHRAYAAVEIQATREFYDYQAKYFDKTTKHFPVTDLREELVSEIKRLSVKACKEVHVEGWARVDWILYREKLFLLEINTVPGMTSESLVPISTEAEGLAFDELTVKILARTL
ncbi:MAG: D-alanine--D-alanine ligase [Gammaproteobacteria bacterium]